LRGTINVGTAFKNGGCCKDGGRGNLFLIVGNTLQNIFRCVMYALLEKGETLCIGSP
jgi:hypothetical protein